MRGAGAWGGVCLGLVLFAGLANGHELVCEETFNGQTRLTISDYPATVHVRVKLINVHPKDVSVAEQVESVALEKGGACFDTPVSLDVGESESEYTQLHIDSYEDCLKLARCDGSANASWVAPVHVFFDTGSAECCAELVCEPNVCTPSGGF